MAIENDELMRKFVRTGMIMQHVEKPFGPRHGHGGHGKCCGHGPEGEPGQHGAGHHGEHGCEGHGPHGHRGRGHKHGQIRALSLLAMHEGMNQKDLAFLLGIRPQSMSELLGKLEEYGLVERRKSAEDARAVEVYLTDDGRTHAKEIAEMRKQTAGDVFKALDDEEKEFLNAVLDKLSAELERMKPHHHKENEDDATQA